MREGLVDGDVPHRIRVFLSERVGCHRGRHRLGVAAQVAFVKAKAS